MKSDSSKDSKGAQSPSQEFYVGLRNDPLPRKLNFDEASREINIPHNVIRSVPAAISSNEDRCLPKKLGRSLPPKAKKPIVRHLIDESADSGALPKPKEIGCSPLLLKKRFPRNLHVTPTLMKRPRIPPLIADPPSAPSRFPAASSDGRRGLRSPTITMPTFIIPKQNTVFYNDRWSRALETRVLLKLDACRRNGSWVPKDYAMNIECMNKLRRQMIRENVEIQLRDYYMKEMQWEERFMDFTFLLNQPGVRFDEIQNKVIASRAVWNEINQVRPSAMVYYVEGELNWGILKKLYSEDVDVSDNEGNSTESQETGSWSFVSEAVDQPQQNISPPCSNASRDYSSSF